MYRVEEESEQHVSYRRFPNQLAPHFQARRAFPLRVVNFDKPSLELDGILFVSGHGLRNARSGRFDVVHFSGFDQLAPIVQFCSQEPDEIPGTCTFRVRPVCGLIGRHSFQNPDESRNFGIQALQIVLTEILHDGRPLLFDDTAIHCLPGRLGHLNRNGQALRVLQKVRIEPAVGLHRVPGIEPIVAGGNIRDSDCTSIPIMVPNFGTRRRAVRSHDLHHVLTGYETTWLGEAEVSAWEAASGGAPYMTIWVLMIIAMVIGLFIDKSAVLRAYRRGRGSRNLFLENFDDRLLDLSVSEMRQSLNIREAGRA